MNNHLYSEDYMKGYVDGHKDTINCIVEKLVSIKNSKLADSEYGKKLHKIANILIEYVNGVAKNVSTETNE